MAKAINVILMVIDDLGWTDVSYHGSVFPTPHIDELAKTGVRLERYYVQPVCSPTRSAIVSGRWPHRMGTQQFTTIPPGTTGHLPTADEPKVSGLPRTHMISELLKSQGYATHAIGKWHLGYASWDYTPTGRGFDSYTGYLQGAVDYYNKTMGVTTVAPNLPKTFLTAYDFWQNRTAFWTPSASFPAEPAADYTLGYYQRAFDAVIANHAAAGDTAKPFFLYYAMQLCHEPLERPPVGIPEGAKAREACSHISGGVSGNRNILCTMTVAMDEEVGRVIASLKAHDMWENSVLWVTTDNGGMADFKLDDSGPTSASSNWPLRAGKATLFDGGVRGVAFVNGGSAVLPDLARGSVRTEYLHAIDITTTLVPLALRSLSTAANNNDNNNSNATTGSSSMSAAEVTRYLASVDGVDAWGVITGKDDPTPLHAEIPVNINPKCRTCCAVASPYVDYPPGVKIPGPGPVAYNAIIDAAGPEQWKLIEGYVGIYDGWWPNDQTNYTREAPPLHDTNVSIRLYSLATDENERHNVAAEHPDVVKRLQARIAFHADPKNGFVSPQSTTPNPLSVPKLHNGTWEPFLLRGEL